MSRSETFRPAAPGLPRGRAAVLCAVPAVVLAAVIGFLTAAPAAAQPGPENPEAVRRFLSVMTSYLELSDHWMQMMSNPDTTLFLAMEGIVEVYERQGRKRDAIPHLRRLAETHRDRPAVRNAVHFKIRDIYNELGEPDKALAELDQVVAGGAAP